MTSNYNPDIHAKAKSIINTEKDACNYERDCLEAGICSACGGNLEDVDGDINYKLGGRMLLTKCVDCGYVAQIN